FNNTIEPVAFFSHFVTYEVLNAYPQPPNLYHRLSFVFLFKIHTHAECEILPLQSTYQNKDTNGDILTNTPTIKPYILKTTENSSSPAGRTLLVN
ncbi:hypothetical protein ACN6QP_16715, partial [Acinetobacter baumannii]